MGRFSANALAALQKGYTTPGATTVYLVLELVLPDGTTQRLGTKGVSSDARGGLEPRITFWGHHRQAIDPYVFALSETELMPELDDKDDDNPEARRYIARMLSK